MPQPYNTNPISYGGSPPIYGSPYHSNCLTLLNGNQIPLRDIRVNTLPARAKRFFGSWYYWKDYEGDWRALMDNELAIRFLSEDGEHFECQVESMENRGDFIRITFLAYINDALTRRLTDYEMDYIREKDGVEYKKAKEILLEEDPIKDRSEILDIR